MTLHYAAPMRICLLGAYVTLWIASANRSESCELLTGASRLVWFRYIWMVQLNAADWSRMERQEN